MSKRKEKTPTLADWELVIDRGPDNPPGTETVQQARWRRDERGYHTFRDHEGVVAEFVPGVVRSVRRVEPAEVPAQKALTEDQNRQSGFELTGHRGGKP